MGTHAALNHLQKQPEAEPSSRRRGPVLMTACTGVFAGFGSLFISTFGVFLKPVASDLGWSRARISLAFTVAVLTVAVVSPMMGRLLDRLPARRLVIPCTLVYGLAFASLSLLTKSLAHLLAIYALMGVVGIATTQLGYAKVVSAWFDASRGRALAAVMAGSGVGFMVFPPLAQGLISHFGWRIAYAVLGAAVLFAALPLAILFLHEPPGFVAKRAETRRRVGNEHTPVVPTFRFLGILSALVLFSFATNGLNTHWASLLTDSGLLPATAAAVLSVAGLATLASKLFTGFLLDRLPANRVAGVLFLCSAIGLAAIVYGRGASIEYAAAVLVGIGMGAESDAVPYLLTRYFGLRRFSELYAYTWTVYAVAGALGPLLAGYIFDHTGSYRVALLIFFAMVLAAAAVFAALPGYRSFEEPILTADGG